MQKTKLIIILCCVVFNVSFASTGGLNKAAQVNAATQIQSILQSKSQRPAYQNKLDSQLINIPKSGMLPKFAHKQYYSTNRIEIDIRCTVTEDLLSTILLLGGSNLQVYEAAGFIRVSVMYSNLEVLAGHVAVKFIRPAQRGHCSTGAVQSEGDKTHGADIVKSLYGSTGDGVRVGVLSDSINDDVSSLASAVSSGDLDGSRFTILAGQAGTGTGEGLAMCQIIHDIAPDAHIYFASGVDSDVQMASNIVALAKAGCNIIVDDITYYDESPFQDGVISRAVNQVSSMGTLYFSSAGNNGNKYSQTSSTWEGDFVDGGAITLDGIEGRVHMYENGGTDNAISVNGMEGQANLFWADPLGQSTNDYDLFLLDAFGNVIGASTTLQSGTQDPYEAIPTSMDTLIGFGPSGYLVVIKQSGEDRFLHLDFMGGKLKESTVGSVRGHNAVGAVGAFSVGATPAAEAIGNTVAGPYPNQFSPVNEMESFSSDGPRRMFFHPDGTPYTPGNFSATGGYILRKPDFLAADGVVTTMPANSGLNPFYGTSAAAPHAAAIAALLESYNPALSPTMLQAALEGACFDVITADWDEASGFGILMADQAVALIKDVFAPLSIISQPADQTAYVGGTVEFQVVVAGYKPITYQWYCNNTSMSGYTNSSILVSNLTLAHVNSSYFCMVSNVQGQLISSNAILTVITSDMDHLAFSTIDKLQALNSAIGLQVSAVNANNQLVNIYNDSVFVNCWALDAGTNILGYDFENGLTSDWNTTSYTYKAEKIDCLGSQYGMLVTGGGVGNFGLSKVLPGIKPDRLDFRVRVSSQKNCGTITIGQPGSTNSVAQFQFDRNGQMGLYSTTVVATPYVPGQWQNVSVLLDWTRKLSTLTINDAVIGTVPFCNTNLNNLTTLHLFNQEVAEVCWDDIAFVKSPVVTKAVQAISNGKWSGDFSLSQTGRCMLQAMSGPFLGNSSIFQVVNPSLLSYLNLRADPVNAGVVNGAGLYLIGQEIQLYAVASKGWMFANWSDGNTTNPRTITMTGFNPEVLAIFSPVNPPAIAQQPTNITIAEGQSAIFSVGVASQIPVNYSWFRNGILLQDATSSTLPILNARAQDSGSSYFCQVSNTEGHVTSQTVKLMVIPYPGSISQFSYKSELILQDNAVSQAKLSLQSITGGISKITVALNNFSHSFPHDLNLYLVSPQGKKVPLICHSGGAQPVTGINLIIDEDATTSLTEWDPLVSGIYQTSPNGDQTTDSLTSFKGCNPNGDWFLVVEDDSAGDSGTLQSWALTIWCDPLPRIISSPCAQIIQATKELKLSVLASNATTYVWFKDGVQLVDNTHIQGSTSSTLSISQVQADDSGEYSVIVCNATGRITSNPAVIRVIPYATPIIAVSGNYGVRKDGFHLPITGAQNATYEIQVSSDLINWKKLQTVTLLTGQTEIIDSSTNVIKRFYRAKLIKP